MEFTPTGLREIFPRTERFTPWAGLRWVMPGPARWLFSTMVLSPASPRTRLRRGLPIAVSQQHAFERTREAFRLFAPDVRIIWFGSRRPPAADQPIEDELKRAGM